MTSTSSVADRARRIDLRLSLLVTIAAASVLVAAVAVSRSSAFHARSIRVMGTVQLSRSEVVALSGVSGRTNVPWLDEGAIERRLDQHPWVADARVQAKLPWTIRIRIVERRPMAVVVQGDRRLLVAGDGTVLGSGDRLHGLPVIVAPAIGMVEGPRPELRDAIRALGAMDPDVSALVRRAAVDIDGTVELRMRGGVRVELGSPSEPVRAATMLGRILEWAAAEGRGVRSISLVAPGAPAIKLGS
ncbi:MAG TPA: FtsQ-type POTRA domain-containing protein [Actinomycetota bacterium]|nr:FtsQ-type POTRA domain-containing protein [Actinomycetota bacterium]